MAGNALTRRNVTGAALAAYALTFQGVHYLWGGESPTTGFDCSGFAQYVYRTFAGVELPRIAQAQAGAGTDVLGGPYLPGDLLFFHGSTHEGISLGGSSFVHAPHTGDVVKISRLGNVYQPNAARRILTTEQASGGKVPGVATQTSDAASWAGWSRRFLQALQAPVSTENMRFVLGWLKAENPADSYSWNPLATTLRTGGALRSGGVQAYKDELSGIQATVQTIQSGQYGAIRRALTTNAGSQKAWDALRASPWDAGHYASVPRVPATTSSDQQRLVVGAKKGGGGGVLDDAGDAALGIGKQALDPFGLLGVGKSPLDVGGAVGDAAGGALGPIGDAIESVGSTIESTAIRVGYGLVGLLLGGFALVLIVRTVGGRALPTPSSGGAASSVAEAAPGPAGKVAGAVAEAAPAAVAA